MGSIGIASILPLRDGNTAGCYRLDLVDVGDVTSVPEEVDGNVPSDVVLASGKQWTTIEPTTFTIDYDETAVLENGATRYEAVASFVVPKDRPELLPVLAGMHRRRVLCTVHTLNQDSAQPGEQHLLLMGNKEEPAQAMLVKRRTGADPTSTDRNQVELVVRWVRDTPTPFYLGDPPAPFTGTCPTVGEQLAPMTWGDIEALLSVGQLADAVASICPVPVLCDVIDDALAAGGVNVVVSGAGTADANGTYLPNGTLNGKAAYLKDGGIEEIWWTGTQWNIGTASGIYNSTDNTTYPWQATTWNQGSASLPVPTVAQSGASATILLGCLTAPQQAELLAELSAGVQIFREDASGTPSLHATVADGGSYTDARVAIRDSDDTINLEHIAGGVTSYVMRRVRTRYTDASGTSQTTSHKVTGLSASSYETDAGTWPRVVVRKSDGSTVIGYTDIVAAAYNVPDGVITKPDGTTVNLMANTALDVRNYRSGIVYKRGLDLWTGEATSYGTGSEGSLFGSGVYDYTPPVYPLSYAEMDRTVGANRWITLKANNTHGNTNRFTDETGAGTYTNNLVVDHLTGLMWYRVAASAATWSTALSNADSSTQGGHSDWRLPTRDELATIINNEELSDPLNYAPFSLAVDLWTCTTAPNSTTNAMRCVGSSGFFNGLAKTSTAQYIMVRTHLS